MTIDATKAAAINLNQLQFSIGFDKDPHHYLIFSQDQRSEPAVVASVRESLRVLGIESTMDYMFTPDQGPMAMFKENGKTIDPGGVFDKVIVNNAALEVLAKAGVEKLSALAPKNLSWTASIS